MRRIVIVMSLVLLAVPAIARERAAGMSWVQRATALDTRMATEAAGLADVSGARPVLLLETNYYAFLPSERMQLRATINPNGYTAPVTMYLYWENRTTGERRYYSAAGGLLPAGQHSDLFGFGPVVAPIYVPALNDFVLFGSSTDTPADLSWGVNGALGASREPGATGLYQWVMELRDAAGKRVLARSNAMYSSVQSQITKQGTISASETWTASNRYV
jgi:hypothetical protein